MFAGERGANHLHQIRLAARVEIRGKRGFAFETKVSKFRVERPANAGDKTAPVCRRTNLRRKRAEQRTIAGVADDDVAFANKLPVSLG